MARPKGLPKTGGRQKGVPNKATASVKEALQLAYQAIGGDPRLASWALENPTEFYKLWGRMLPQEVGGPDGGPLEIAGILREVIRQKNTHTDR